MLFSRSQKQSVYTLKTINYRGVLSFRIPDNWKEEYAENGGGTFYLDKPNSGTLRIYLNTFQQKSDSTPSLDDFIKHTEGEVQVIDTDKAMSHYKKTAVENGQNIVLYYWEVANVVSNKYLRIALFSYTILQSQENGEAMIREIALLHHEVSQTKFAPDIGVFRQSA